MRKTKLDNETLDELGKALIRAEARRTPDVDRIVNDPNLFARVRARIETEAVPQVPTASLSSLRWLRPQAAAFAGFAGVLALAFTAIGLLNMGNGDVAVSNVQIPEDPPDVARPVFPLQESEIGKLSPGRASDEEIRTEKAVYRRPSASIAKTRKTVVHTRPPAQFYPVAYTGDPAETDGGGRIVRVDLKRSSLFALGVDIPLENDDELIRADLLIGADGVTRAIRLVE